MSLPSLTWSTAPVSDETTSFLLFAPWLLCIWKSDLHVFCFWISSGGFQHDLEASHHVGPEPGSGMGGVSVCDEVYHNRGDRVVSKQTLFWITWWLVAPWFMMVGWMFKFLKGVSDPDFDLNLFARYLSSSVRHSVGLRTLISGRLDLCLPICNQSLAWYQAKRVIQDRDLVHHTPSDAFESSLLFDWFDWWEH